MTRALVFCVISLLLAGCQVALPNPDKLPPLPSPAMVCGPLRGIVAGVIGSSAADMRKACAIAQALTEK